MVGWEGNKRLEGRTDWKRDRLKKTKNWEGLREGPCVVLNVSFAAASNCEQMFGHCGGEHLERLRPRLTRLENSFAAGSTKMYTHASSHNPKVSACHSPTASAGGLDFQSPYFRVFIFAASAAASPSDQRVKLSAGVGF